MRCWKPDRFINIFMVKFLKLLNSTVPHKIYFNLTKCSTYKKNTSVIKKKKKKVTNGTDNIIELFQIYTKSTQQFFQIKVL